MIMQRVKHKMNVIKHKELYPWEKYPPGSVRTRINPEDLVHKKETKAHTEAYAFAWMVFWGCVPGNADNKFELNRTITYWWARAYSKPFPEEGGVCQDLVERVFCRLIDRGHDSLRLDPKESDYELPRTLRDDCGNWVSAKNKHISYLQDEEADMAKLTLKGLKKPGSATTPSAKPEQARTSKATRNSDAIPNWVQVSKPGTRAHESKVRICDLLLDQQHTDAEIALIIDGELEYKVSEGRINFYRDTLNKGRFDTEPFNFSKPDPAIERIVQSAPPAEVVGKKSTGKKSTDKKPTGKKSTGKKFTGKKTGKKLVLKKK